MNVEIDIKNFKEEKNKTINEKKNEIDILKNEIEDLNNLINILTPALTERFENIKIKFEEL